MRFPYLMLGMGGILLFVGAAVAGGAGMFWGLMCYAAGVAVGMLSMQEADGRFG